MMLAAAVAEAERARATRSTPTTRCAARSSLSSARSRRRHRAGSLQVGTSCTSRRRCWPSPRRSCGCGDVLQCMNFLAFVCGVTADWPITMPPWMGTAAAPTPPDSSRVSCGCSPDAAFSSCMQPSCPARHRRNRPSRDQALSPCKSDRWRIFFFMVIAARPHHSQSA